jgi:hypothetical protein
VAKSSKGNKGNLRQSLKSYERAEQGREPGREGAQAVSIAMKPFQERVAAEKAELDERREKLIAFIHGEVFKTLPAEEQDRLSWQIDVMDEYSEVLRQRIAVFQ